MFEELFKKHYAQKKISCSYQLFYTKTWKVWNNYYNKFNEQVQSMKFRLKIKALEFLYGGTKFHTKSSEKYEFKNKEFLYHNMNTLTKTFSSMEIDGIIKRELQ